MILVTGGTGFIGRVLIRQLVEAGHEVRVLIRPSLESPALPRGIPLDVTVTSLNDARGLQAAMVGVETVYHLVSTEWLGASADIQEIDIEGTRAVVDAAVQANVNRLFFVSHLGVDRASAYPVLKAKAIAESFIQKSGLAYTILRTGLVFGKDDHFTTQIAQLVFLQPGMFFLPGDGSTVIQPIWVEDLATCLVWALEDPDTRNQVIEMGGPEYLTFRQVLEAILRAIGVERRLQPVRPPYLRALTVFLENMLPNLPVSAFWLDYMAANRTVSLDTIPRTFGLLPSRFSTRLDYLTGVNWRRAAWRSLFTRRANRSKK
jgi:NADH dehydrogenase